MKLTRPAAALAVALLGMTALSACAPGDDSAAADDAGTAQTQAADTADSGGSVAEPAFGGDWSVTVDGATISIPDATVVCQEAAGGLSIAIAAPTAAAADQAIAVQLTLGDPPTVQAVAALDADRNALAYTEGTGMGSAEVAVSGSEYTITGEGLVTEIDNPTSMNTKPFEIVVDCG